jgi:hypothetical protein
MRHHMHHGLVNELDSYALDFYREKVALLLYRSLGKTSCS